MFIPRDPVVQNQFCKYGSQTATGDAGIGGVIAYAGAVVYLDENAENQEAEVYKMAYNSTPFKPFGVLMQKVKTGYHSVHPAGFVMPGDLGSSDAIAQASYNNSGAIIGTQAVPVGVAHLGIWDTVHFTCLGTGGTAGTGTADYGTVSTAMLPGAALFPANDEGKLTNSTSNAATAFNGADLNNGQRCSTTQVATVVKGASVAKCQANITNTVLYPVRVKLLV